MSGPPTHDGFRPKGVKPTIPSTPEALRAIIAEAGESAGWETRVLAQPAGAGKRDLCGHFDAVCVTMQDQTDGFGAPDLAFDELAAGGWAGTWRTDAADSSILDQRVVAAAQNRTALRPDDYNGALLGLRDYQVEKGADSSANLKLLCERTNWATALATSHGLSVDPGREVALRSLPDLDDFGRTSWQCASAVSVHLALISSDGYLLLTRRAADAQFGAGRLNSAVNGAVELGYAPLLRHADVDALGRVSLAHAAVREAYEEVGPHLALKPVDLVARNLSYYRDENQANPFVVFEARSGLTFDDIVGGSRAHMNTTEAPSETSGDYVGLPLEPRYAEEVMSWCKRNCQALHGPALLTILLTLGHFAPSEELWRMWRQESEQSEEHVLRRRSG